LVFLLFKNITRTEKGTLKVPQKCPDEETKEGSNNNFEGSLKKKCPPVSLLKQYKIQIAAQNENENIKHKLKQCFDEYGLDFLSIVNIEAGPTITKFTVRMDTTGRLNQLFKIEREISRAFQKILKKAELENCNVHTMRHTFATRLFERNVPAKTISQLRGHTSVPFTLDTYTHVLPNTKKQAIEVLESNDCRMESY
jgi:chorismate mutase